MKKYLLAFATLVACMCLTVSCSNNEDDDPVKPIHIDVYLNWDAIEPCLDWTLDKTGMQSNSRYSGKEWKQASYGEENELTFVYCDDYMTHYYEFGDNSKLKKAEVQFPDYYDDDFNKIVKAINRKYNVELEKSESGGSVFYTAKTMINKHITKITIIGFQNILMTATFESIIDLSNIVDDPKYLQGRWVSDRIVEDGKESLYDSYMEFNGDKVKTSFEERNKEIEYIYETGKLTFKLLIMGTSEYKINFFTPEAIQLEQTDHFGRTKVMTFTKEK